ncbi:MAG TPA: hypothetical protein VMV36_03895 [Ignavibacteriaceae bacterium]|nr:hypothetical protein [Ignavibacteriaceae bacterium]
MKDRPKIICTIGSSRFCDVEAVMKWEFEKQGFICIGMHLLPEWYCKQKGIGKGHAGETEGVAKIMDELHLKKIEMADEIFVINVNGYIGERTTFEIDYATKLGKPIKYLKQQDHVTIKDCQDDDKAREER